MRECVIVSGCRTPMGKAKKGTLIETRPDDLAAIAIKEAVNRATPLKPEEIDDVILGCAFPEGEQGMNVARIASFRAGLPYTVPAMTINRFCSSGLQSVAIGAERIMLGFADVIVAGGVEHMTMIPMGGLKPAPNPWLMDNYPEVYYPMGNTAELVAREFNLAREELDRFGLNSHLKALAAIREGRFKDEIVPVTAKLRKQNPDGTFRIEEVVLDTDEGPRESTLEEMAKLKPAFQVDGLCTAGNSSQMNDAAAAVVLMSKEKAAELGLKPRLTFRGFAVAGVPPEKMGLGPTAAVPKLLNKAGLKVEDIDLWEINEAFAAQAVPCIRVLGIDESKVNVNGGAIALGHPLGCTGTKLLVTLMYEMERRNARWGVVTMCIGGGMGAAGLFEREAANEEKPKAKGKCAARRKATK